MPLVSGHARTPRGPPITTKQQSRQTLAFKQHLTPTSYELSLAYERETQIESDMRPLKTDVLYHTH